MKSFYLRAARFLAVALCLLAAGCDVGPKYHTPTVACPGGI